MKAILVLLLVLPCLTKHRAHSRKKAAKTNTLESQKSMLAAQLMRDRKTISLVKKIQEKINQKLKKQRQTKEDTESLKSMMPLLDKTADFFKSSEMLSEEEDKKNQTIQEQFMQLLQRLPQDSQETQLKNMQAQLQDALKKAHAQNGARFSQSGGETKINNENNSGLKLVEQQQSKILEQEQVIKNLREMQEKFEYKLNQEEQKINNLAQKEKSIVSIVTPSPPAPTTQTAPAAPSTTTPTISSAPTLVSPTIVSTPSTQVKPSSSQQSLDEEQAAIAKHNQEVYEYEQQQQKKAEAIRKAQEESIQRDRQFQMVHQKLASSRGGYEEVQKYAAPTYQQEYARFQKNLETKQHTEKGKAQSMQYDESPVLIKKTGKEQVMMNYQPDEVVQQQAIKVSQSTNMQHLQNQQQLVQQTVKQQIKMAAYKQNQPIKYESTTPSTVITTTPSTVTPSSSSPSSSSPSSSSPSSSFSPSSPSSSFSPSAQPQRMSKMPPGVVYKTVGSNVKKPLNDKYETVSYYKSSH